MEHFDQPAETRSVSSESDRLRDTVERAATLIADGHDEDAIALLSAVIEAGYPDTDARVLLGEVLARRGDPAGRDLLAEAAHDPVWGPRARAALENITGSTTGGQGSAPALGTLAVRRPFGHREGQAPAVARLMAQADEDLARGRLESALDLTIHAETLAPTDLSLYVRHAELLVATRRPREALALAATIRRLATLRAESEYDLTLARIVAHADPTLENVLALARAALAAGDASLADVYLPVAAAALLDAGDGLGALALAREWYAQAPQSAAALLTYVRELLRAGQVDEAAALTRDPGHEPAALVAAIAVAAVTGSDEQWTLTARLGRDIAAGRPDRAEAPRLLAEVAAVVPSAPAMPVLRALLALWQRDLHEAILRLKGYRPADPAAAFVAAVCSLRALGPDADPAEVLPPLRAAFDLACRPDVAAFAAKHPLFDPPATADTLGEALAGLLMERDDTKAAAEVYRRLAEQYPDNHRYARSYAEIVGRAGETKQALAQLEALRQREVAAGRHAEAERTLEAMVRIAPNHLSLREHLVEVYLKRGRVSEALGELFILAQLMERKARTAEAIAQLRRAAEIATLTGEWGKVEPIYAYMIRLAPEDIGLRHAAAATFVQHGRVDEAKAHLQEVVRITVAQEDYDEAIAALHQIIALDPADLGPYHRLGELLAAVGEYRQAERVYGRLVQLAPDDPAVKAKQAALAALARGQP